MNCITYENNTIMINFFHLFLYVICFSRIEAYKSDIDYTKIFIPKGIPFGLPAETKFLITNVTGSSYFTSDSKYNCNNSHQYDWNKLTGISFTPWRTDIDALMVAWRYLIKTNEFQVAPYYNVHMARILPLFNETITVKENDPFNFFVDYNGVKLSYHDQIIYKPKPNDLIPNFYLSFRVLTWFGGSSLPPSDIYLYINYQ